MLSLLLIALSVLPPNYAEVVYDTLAPKIIIGLSGRLVTQCPECHAHFTTPLVSDVHLTYVGAQDTLSGVLSTAKSGTIRFAIPGATTMTVIGTDNCGNKAAVQVVTKVY